MKSIAVAPQLPLDPDISFSQNSFSITKSASAPENNRMIVKLDASMAISPNANRQRTELPANATSEKPVANSVFAKELFGMAQPDDLF